MKEEYKSLPGESFEAYDKRVDCEHKNYGLYSYGFTSVKFPNKKWERRQCTDCEYRWTWREK